MMDCAYCERPLICDECRDPYVPPTREHYEALSRSDLPIRCEGCGVGLVCYWCKTPYDGRGGSDQDADEGVDQLR